MSSIYLVARRMCVVYIGMWREIVDVLVHEHAVVAGVFLVNIVKKG